MMPEVNLSLCPFCGSKAKRIDIESDSHGNEGGAVIECTHCMASGPVCFGEKTQLYTSWNRRTFPEPTNAEISNWLMAEGWGAISTAFVRAVMGRFCGGRPYVR